MNTESCGYAAVNLGAGRDTKESCIDFSAGFVLNKKVGEYVEVGETFATLYSNSLEKCFVAEKVFLDAICIDEEKAQDISSILARVSTNGVERY